MFAGVTCDAKGRLFAADFGLTGSSTKRAAVMFSAKDVITVLPDPGDGTELGGLNGIAAVPGQGVYASDTTGALIVHYSEHADASFDASIAARELPGANGLAYNPRNGRLYLALSEYLGGENKLVSFAVGADGTLTDQRTDWTGSEVVDGVAVDEHGELYIALWARGTIIRASDRVVVGQTNNAASLAFRGGDLLFTDYDVVSSQVEGGVGVPVSSSGLYAVALGVCGAL
jgi:sugar lactone lactonase YvrE